MSPIGSPSLIVGLDCTGPQDEGVGCHRRQGHGRLLPSYRHHPPHVRDPAGPGGADAHQSAPPPVTNLLLPPG